MDAARGYMHIELLVLIGAIDSPSRRQSTTTYRVILLIIPSCRSYQQYLRTSWPQVEERRQEGAYDASTTCVGIARLQADDQLMVAGPMGEVKDVDFGAPLHCLVIAGEGHMGAA